MEVFHTPQFRKSFLSLSQEHKKKFEKQIQFLLRDIRHPSLHAKKHEEARGIWQARVDRQFRFYFLIEGDMYVLLDVVAHPK